MLSADVFSDKNHDRTLLRLFLLLNAALTAAFLVHLFQTPRKDQGGTAPPTIVSPAGNRARERETTIQAGDVIPLSPEQAPDFHLNLRSSAELRKPTTWREVPTKEYPLYLLRLQSAGCPPETIRSLVRADVDAWLADKRLQVAIGFDPEWWRVDPLTASAQGLATIGRALEEEQRALLTKLLGPDAGLDPVPVEWWTHVPLTGPVLGALSPEVHHRVQEIYGRCLDRQRSYVSERIGVRSEENEMELVRIREETRAELAQILSPAGLEEFLVRYSHNASQVRVELGRFEPTAAEFRRIFAAVDPLDRQVQIDWGSLSFLSQKQLERYEQQRRAAIERVLPADRFQKYLRTRPPGKGETTFSVTGS